MSIRAMSRKAYRFPRPDVSLLASALVDGEGKPTKDIKTIVHDFHKAYEEIHPAKSADNGMATGNYGNVTVLPDWVAKDLMFQAAVRDHDIVIIADEPTLPGVGPTAQDTEDAARKATLLAAERSKLQAMSRADIIKYGNNAFGLNLNAAKSKPALIDEIMAASDQVAKATLEANQPSGEPSNEADDKEEKSSEGSGVIE